MRMENAGRTLQVALLAFVGLLFYVAVLLVIGFAGELLLSTYAHAQSVPASGIWTPTGSLATARAGHTATLLPNGKVLVVGGIASDTSPVLDSAELYDPATGAWSATGHLASAHSGHTATLLKDGKVLVVGNGTAELYDPASGSWALTGTPITSRSLHAAVALPDGRVLISGGYGDFLLASAELYDPAAGSWTSTGSLLTARYSHTMTLLQDGTVLAAGGTIDDGSDFISEIDDCELYDPATGTWKRTASLLHASAYHTTTLLANGRILVAGGYFSDYPGGFARATSLNQAEVFDPITHVWSATDSLHGARESHTATALFDGHVLVAGGLDWSGTYPNIVATPLSSAELYDYQHATWTSAGSLGVARSAHTATLLADGRVLVAGGYTSGNGASVTTSSAEIYTPSVQIDSTFTGSWYDPNQSGQGLMLEVLPGNGLLALWFSFDPAGKQAWFGGVGTYSGNVASIPGAALPTGGKWIPNFDPNAIVRNPWGTLTFTFADHDHGRVDFNSSSGYGAGSMNLTRLTSVATATQPSALASPIGPPVAVVTDASGNLYFSSAPNQIFKVDAYGALTHVAGTGVPGFSGDGGPATQAQLDFPLVYPEEISDPADFGPVVGGLALDATHNLYIADAFNGRVRRIDPNGIITTFAGKGGGCMYTGDNIPATSGVICSPQGVAVDSGGNVYISDLYGALFKVTPDNIFHLLVGNNCGIGYLGVGVCAPEEIAVDSAGNLFVPDAYCRVRELRPDRSMITIAGADNVPGHGTAYTCGYSGDGGPATKAALDVPFGVAVDAAANLYIADTLNNCVRKVAGGIITTVAGICDTGTDRGGYSGDGGPATSARLNQPYGVAVDASGNLYIADTYNYRLRKVAADRTITTVAGNGAALVTPPPATIGPAFTGNWYDPNQSGHGLMIEVLSDNRFLAVWFAFTPTGDQAWFGGLGTYSGNTATISGAALPTGGKWIPNFDPNAITRNPWGTLTFTFSDCNHGKVDFNSTFDGFGSGSMNLTRLTLALGQACP